MCPNYQFWTSPVHLKNVYIMFYMHQPIQHDPINNLKPEKQICDYQKSPPTPKTHPTSRNFNFKLSSIT